MVEVQIDEIGPSLRWATASVNKTQRSGGEWSGGGGGGGGGGARDGQGAEVPPAPVARVPYGPDEAPFRSRSFKQWLERARTTRAPSGAGAWR